MADGNDLPTRLRDAFKAWGLRSLGDEAADEIGRLRDALAEQQRPDAEIEKVEADVDLLGAGFLLFTCYGYKHVPAEQIRVCGPDAEEERRDANLYTERLRNALEAVRSEILLTGQLGEIVDEALS